MKKAMALIAACILALAALSVSAEESPVTGDWYTDMGGMPVQLTLAGDGSYTLAVPGGDSVTGTWVLDDGYIYMDGAAAPDMANMYYERLVNEWRAKGIHVETGRFRTEMQVSLVNDGPVTILLDSEKTF